MILAKMATLGLLKIKLFWNKGYDVILFVYDVTNKFLSHESNSYHMSQIDQSLVTLAFVQEKL